MAGLTIRSSGSPRVTNHQAPNTSATQAVPRRTACQPGTGLRMVSHVPRRPRDFTSAGGAGVGGGAGSDGVPDIAAILAAASVHARRNVGADKPVQPKSQAK